MNTFTYRKSLIAAALVVSGVMAGCGEGHQTATAPFGTSHSALSAYTGEPSSQIYGDLTGDGEINVVDAQCLSLTILAVAADEALPKCLWSRAAADLNCDGALDVTDYNLVIYKSLDSGPLNPRIDGNANGVHDHCEPESVPDHEVDCGGPSPETGPATACCAEGSANFSLQVTPYVDIERNYAAFDLGYPDESTPRVVVTVSGLTKASRVNDLATLIYDRLQCPDAPAYVGKHTWAKQALLREIMHGLSAFEGACGARLDRGMVNILFGPMTNRQGEALSPAGCIDKQLDSRVRAERTSVNLDRRYLQVRRALRAGGQSSSALISFPAFIGHEGCEERGDCLPGQLAATVEIESVTLAMFPRQGTPDNRAGHPLEIHAVDDAPAATEMLWADVRPGEEGTVDLLDQARSERVYVDFDITAAVEGWQADPERNRGLLLDAAFGYNAYYSCTPHNWLNPSVLRGHHLPLLIVRFAH